MSQKSLRIERWMSLLRDLFELKKISQMSILAEAETPLKVKVNNVSMPSTWHVTPASKSSATVATTKLRLTPEIEGGIAVRHCNYAGEANELQKCYKQVTTSPRVDDWMQCALDSCSAFEVFQFLELRDQGGCMSMVSTGWKEVWEQHINSNNGDFWRHVCIERWPSLKGLQDVGSYRVLCEKLVSLNARRVSGTQLPLDRILRYAFAEASR